MESKAENFEEYLEKIGYGWNDFDRCHEMENLIEGYADQQTQELREQNQKQAELIEKLEYLILCYKSFCSPATRETEVKLNKRAEILLSTLKEKK